MEFYGSFFKMRCVWCYDVRVNWDSFICDFLVGKGVLDLLVEDVCILEENLLWCIKDNCGGLFWLYVVWFGENLDCLVFNVV